MAAGNAARRRTYFTKADGEALVRDWRDSKLSAAEYCRQRGVTARRLNYWSRKLEGASFVEVIAKGPADAPSGEDGGIEVFIGEALVRLPDRPGMAEEVLAILAGGARS